MKLHRRLAVLLVAASLCAGAAAQGRTPLDDETIFAAVEQALQGSRSLVAARITVQSRDGFVTLGGRANTVAEIATAGRIASRVRGVTGVNNEIRINDRHWRA
jgi:osmotically-inducible protein OsmY